MLKSIGKESSYHVKDNIPTPNPNTMEEWRRRNCIITPHWECIFPLPFCLSLVSTCILWPNRQTNKQTKNNTGHTKSWWDRDGGKRIVAWLCSTTRFFSFFLSFPSLSSLFPSSLLSHLSCPFSLLSLSGSLSVSLSGKHTHTHTLACTLLSPTQRIKRQNQITKRGWLQKYKAESINAIQHINRKKKKNRANGWCG